MNYKIEKGIPIPSDNVGGRRKSCFRETAEVLDIGESFVAQLKKRDQVGSLGKRLGKVFVTRVIDADTIRVWRIK